MKINSMVFAIAMLLLVAISSYYVGSSKRNTCSAQKSEPSPPPSLAQDNPDKNIVPNISSAVIEYKKEDTTASKRIEGIKAEYAQKKQETEAFYADKFRQLQQAVENTLSTLNAADKSAYAKFAEQLHNTVSTSSGYTSINGYISPGGRVSANGWQEVTTNTKVVGAPAREYRQNAQRLNEAKNNVMDEYEMDFEHLQRQRACALSDIERDKELAIASASSVSGHTSNTMRHGVVSGILFNEESPLAVINGNMVREGKSINGVKVIKIHQDSVDFEFAGTHWSQKVNEPASANWH